MALDNGATYIKIRVPPSLIKKLDEWKEISGSSYSNTVRTAVLEYLDEKMKKESK